MQQVAENIYRLGSAHHNFFMLTEGGKATVVDAGCSKEFTKLEQLLASLGMKRDDVEGILLTHAHADHIGFAAEAHAKGIEVRASEPEQPIAVGEVTGHAVTVPEMPLYRLGTWRFLIGLLRVGITKAPRVPEVVTFSDGETLDLPGRPQVVYTPGHTVGHASFYVAASETLFSGDALVTMDLFSQEPGPQVMPDMFHTDPALARESLARLEELDTALVLPGHGDPFAGSVGDAVAAARR